VGWSGRGFGEVAERLSNAATGDEMADVLALVQEQLADIAVVQQRQAELTGSASSAGGMVEVTVDARGQVVKTVIDGCYLDENEFEELAGHVTEAAGAAAREVGRRVADMMVPISERRGALPAFSEVLEGAPDLGELIPPGFDLYAAARPPQTAPDADGGEESAFPTVRR